MRFAKSLAALTLFAGVASAQTNLTLDEAITLARRNNTQFLQSVNGRRQADANLRAAYAALLPTLGANMSGRYQQTGQQFFQGVALSNAADYAGALEQFRQAYAKSPNYAVLYNIGQAEAVLGHLLEAITALSRYLKDGGAEIPEARREEVKTQLAALEARLAELTVTTEHTGAVALAVAVSVDAHWSFNASVMPMPPARSRPAGSASGSPRRSDGSRPGTRRAPRGRGTRRRSAPGW